MLDDLQIASALTRPGGLRRPRLIDALELGSVGSHIDVTSLPFAPGDATGGTENELQAEVKGLRNQVDLPVSIRRSRYFTNLSKHVASNEAPRSLIAQLNQYLANEDGIWENSWVRFPRKYLSALSNEIFESDLRKGSSLQDEFRGDRNRFVFSTQWGDWVRVPISYLLKLALADAAGKQSASSDISNSARRLMEHFSNDLTSPETHSFFVVSSSRNALGRGLAFEMGLRFLLTHLLVEWSNKIFNLESLGQKASVHFAPHPPVRQQELNDCISDSFYSDLFVSPCLSGWNDGEAKQEYMRLAYRTTSRSRINAVIKLRDAGLISNNLVVLPNTSSVSLANNGTHLSFGSKKIGRLLAERASGFGIAEEKRIGDLVIKISEHFLPLFVGTYTAAPYRLAFSDLHPERALGFLPHALDYTHLRMVWRHWRGKAHLRCLRKSISPFGPPWLDSLVSNVFRVKGDLVPDYRLIDFPTAWLCTETSSAVDGSVGNVERLSCDLDEMGVTDRRLKFYMPLGLRQYHTMGFSGFESRQYSLFESLEQDFGSAADLQQLIIILAYKYVLSGSYQHQQIPHDPSSESERRLPFFSVALGLPAFNVRVDTPNDLLRRIVSLTVGTTSSRHGGYMRVPVAAFRNALLELVEADGPDIIELLGLKEGIADLKERLRSPKAQVFGRLLHSITGSADEKAALSTDARQFNLAAEQYYRHGLKRKLLRESLQFAVNAVKRDNQLKRILETMTDDVVEFFRSIEERMLSNELTPQELMILISILVHIVTAQRHTFANAKFEISADTSIH